MTVTVLRQRQIDRRQSSICRLSSIEKRNDANFKNDGDQLNYRSDSEHQHCDSDSEQQQATAAATDNCHNTGQRALAKLTTVAAR